MLKTKALHKAMLYIKALHKIFLLARTSVLYPTYEYCGHIQVILLFIACFDYTVL